MNTEIQNTKAIGFVAEATAMASAEIIEEYCASNDLQLVAMFFFEDEAGALQDHESFSAAVQFLRCNADVMILPALERRSAGVINNRVIKRAIAPKQIVACDQSTILSELEAKEIVGRYRSGDALWKFVWRWFSEQSSFGKDYSALEASVGILERLWSQRSYESSPEGGTRHNAQPCLQERLDKQLLQQIQRQERIRARRSATRIKQVEKFKANHEQRKAAGPSFKKKAFRPPYAYDLIDGQLVTNEERARVLRAIRRLDRWAKKSGTTIQAWLGGKNQMRNADGSVGRVFPPPSAARAPQRPAPEPLYKPALWPLGTVLHFLREMRISSGEWIDRPEIAGDDGRHKPRYWCLIRRYGEILGKCMAVYGIEHAKSMFDLHEHADRIDLFKLADHQAAGMLIRIKEGHKWGRTLWCSARIPDHTATR